MRTQFLLTLASATLATALPHSNSPRDDPIELVVSIWNGNSLTCDTSLSSTVASGNGCQDRTLSAGGSALVRASIASPHGFVTGYSEAGCKGTVVVVMSKADGCMSFDDVSVASWISGAPFDEGG
ncbi:hypothetical protein K491DRAFT_681635 [Lophiostoma macrostomum CBS 122681]|uniref:Uncharacterized protein n=1 Tax=Lophiostoma macrostomum CBS 122681 TaxID=1314788 RepID=A0A6A6SWR4_9PLEO|nr:hypothetical protein K491DRAFT_681635 [Lophiostoma macrostomum CBS 122681]